MKSKGTNENMIIISIYGGLGNQMFQYAAGRNISNKLNTELKLDVKVGYFDKEEFITSHGLNVFNIVGVQADSNEIYKLTGKNENTFDLSFSELSEIISIPSTYIKEKNFSFDNDILQFSGSMYMDGYFQSEKYFIESADIIRDDFKLKHPFNDQNRNVLSSIYMYKSVSLHVRNYENDKVESVSDYSFKIMKRCDDLYYRMAVNLIMKKVKNPYFYVFSNDIKWAKNNLSYIKNVKFIDINSGANSYKDLILMSKCKHNIVSNSTFSWWSAWLNNNPNKIVISPKKWFNSKSYNSKNDQDIRPKSWIQL